LLGAHIQRGACHETSDRYRGRFRESLIEKSPAFLPLEIHWRRSKGRHRFRSLMAQRTATLRPSARLASIAARTHAITAQKARQQTISLPFGAAADASLLNP